MATYNIRSLRDDRAAVVRVIRDLRADIVCIQEAPRFAFWRRICRRLADDVGLSIVAGGRPAGANLILAEPATTVHNVRSVIMHRYTRRDRRGIALADLSIRGSRLVVAGIHLSGVETERLGHLGELHRLIDDFTPSGVPTLIAGDVNDIPGSPTWRKLVARHVDAAAVRSIGDPMTNQPLTPTRRIDALFAGAGIAVVQTQAVASPDVNAASDHRPVLADVWVAGPPGP